MVLCPYVHLVMRSDISPLSLQPTEVSSAHWVPLRALMSPHLRTFERTDVSERFFNRGSQLTRRVLRAMVGQLLFTARKLVPTESTFSRSTADYVPPGNPVLHQETSLIGKVNEWWYGPRSITAMQEPPLILWGLTYGILANFLGLMPTDDPKKMWDWPTLSLWDIRFIIWLTTYNFRAQKIRALGSPVRTYDKSKQQDIGVELGGLDVETFTAADTSLKNQQYDRASSLDTVGVMLDGYFDRLRNAIWIALALRLGTGTLLAALLFRQYKLRRNMSHL